MSVKDDVFEAGGVLIAVVGVFCLMALSSEGQKLIRRLAHVEHELVDWSTDAWACKKCDHVRRWGGNGGDVWEGRNGEE